MQFAFLKNNNGEQRKTSMTKVGYKILILDELFSITLYRQINIDNSTSTILIVLDFPID